MRTLPFPPTFVAAAALVGGPWLVYSAASWGNPLQGNLERSGNMVQGGEPLSSGERLISRQRRSNLLQQAAERGFVFDVKFSPPVTLEDFLNIVANQVFGLAFQP